MRLSMLGGMSARRMARNASKAPYTPKIAPDAPALGVGGVDHTGARMAQRDGLTTALKLGRGPGREDA